MQQSAQIVELIGVDGAVLIFLPNPLTDSIILKLNSIRNTVRPVLWNIVSVFFVVKSHKFQCPFCPVSVFSDDGTSCGQTQYRYAQF
jgi:hypothetical protein